MILPEDKNPKVPEKPVESPEVKQWRKQFNDEHAKYEDLKQTYVGLINYIQPLTDGLNVTQADLLSVIRKNSIRAVEQRFLESQQDKKDLVKLVS